MLGLYSMGQQQLFLLVLGVVIVGLAVVGGTQYLCAVFMCPQLIMNPLFNAFKH